MTAVRVTFVCTGNICRSPMADVVMSQLVSEAGLSDQIAVDSSGTGGWHVGHGADQRAVRTLARHGYDGSGHRAQQFEPSWVERYDLVVALDGGHLRDLRRMASDDEQRDKIQLLRRFDPELASGRASDRDLDVEDPYYEDEQAFEEVFVQVERSCRALLEHLRTEYGL